MWTQQSLFTSVVDYTPLILMARAMVDDEAGDHKRNAHLTCMHACTLECTCAHAHTFISLDAAGQRWKSGCYENRRRIPRILVGPQGGRYNNARGELGGGQHGRFPKPELGLAWVSRSPFGTVRVHMNAFNKSMWRSRRLVWSH